MTVRNWYWLADDGRIFSGASETQVAADDPAYVAWCNTYTATRWPADNAGAQTDASLQDVIGPFGLYANLTYYAANVRYNRQSAGVQITSISTAYFASDPTSRNTVSSAYSYALANPSNVVNWKMSDGTFVAMDNTKTTTLMNNMSHFVQACYDCENTTAGGISGGTITTRSQVDAAFAAVSNVFP